MFTRSRLPPLGHDLSPRNRFRWLGREGEERNNVDLLLARTAIHLLGVAVPSIFAFVIGDLDRFLLPLEIVPSLPTRSAAELLPVSAWGELTVTPAAIHSLVLLPDEFSLSIPVKVAYSTHLVNKFPHLYQ
jgi:hypothetical protein